MNYGTEERNGDVWLLERRNGSALQDRKGRENVIRHIETLERFNGVVHDAAALDGGESGCEDAFEWLVNRIQERTEEMSEKLELYDGPSIEERQELDALSRLSPEMLGLSGELANMQATIIKAKKQIIDDMPEGMPMSQAVVKHDMQALYSVIQTAGLMADGIITRIRQFKSGRFTE